MKNDNCTFTWLDGNGNGRDSSPKRAPQQGYQQPQQGFPQQAPPPFLNGPGPALHSDISSIKNMLHQLVTTVGELRQEIRDLQAITTGQMPGAPPVPQAHQ